MKSLQICTVAHQNASNVEDHWLDITFHIWLNTIFVSTDLVQQEQVQPDLSNQTCPTRPVQQEQVQPDLSNQTCPTRPVQPDLSNQTCPTRPVQPELVQPEMVQL
jgi:hypothetical protein